MSWVVFGLCELRPFSLTSVSIDENRFTEQGAHEWKRTTSRQHRTQHPSRLRARRHSAKAALSKARRLPRGAVASQVAAVAAAARQLRPQSQAPVFTHLPRAAAVAHR